MTPPAANTTRETRHETLPDGSIVTFVTYTNNQNDLVNVTATNYERPATPTWTDEDLDDWMRRQDDEMFWR